MKKLFFFAYSFKNIAVQSPMGTEMSKLNPTVISVVMIDGKMVSKKARTERECAMEDIRSGKKHYLFATYRLAKEGIDIPRLDRLFLTTPQKDYAIVVQSVGRIARTFEGKSDPVCYDYVDNIGYLIGAYKKRCSHYKKCGCQFLGGLYDT